LWFSTPNRKINIDRENYHRDNVEMMYSIRVLLCFAIIACPLNCLGALADGTRDDRTLGDCAAQAIEPTQCQCCSHTTLEARTAPQQSPASPENDSPCPSCLCGGAISCSDEIALEISAGELPVCEILAADFRVCDLQPQSSKFTRAERLAPLNVQSGRFVRILYESLLL
jgi:hypothetical protein